MLIGVSGKVHAGKDEIARILVENHGFKRYALATKMKEAALALDPIVAAYINADGRIEYVRLSKMIEDVGAEEAKKWPEVRRLYQRMGTEVGRETIDKTLWIKLVFKLVHSRTADVVISDLRFLNEALAIGDRNGWVWRVERPGAGLEGEAGKHVSETELHGDLDGIYDEIIQNDGSIADLEKKVAEALAACHPYR